MADAFVMLILSSPSGAGKTTLTRKLEQAFPELCFSVSHTTRAPRATEKDGREYHFVDRAAFERMVAEDAFLEWAEVHGNLYGTAADEVERAFDELRAVILAERAKRTRRAALAESLLRGGKVTK